MTGKISKRLEAVVDSLPLEEGIRILEIGCSTGSAARAIAGRLSNVYVLGIDRSAKAIHTAVACSKQEIAAGKLSFQEIAIEDFVFADAAPFDLAFAIRVGALDGRHPEKAEKAFSNIAKALTVHGKLFIDGASGLKEINISKYK